MEPLGGNFSSTCSSSSSAAASLGRAGTMMSREATMTDFPSFLEQSHFFPFVTRILPLSGSLWRSSSGSGSKVSGNQFQNLIHILRATNQTRKLSDDLIGKQNQPDRKSFVLFPIDIKGANRIQIIFLQSTPIFLWSVATLLRPAPIQRSSSKQFLVGESRSQFSDWNQRQSGGSAWTTEASSWNCPGHFAWFREELRLIFI